jgi:beta-galactosidase
VVLNLTRKVSIPRYGGSISINGHQAKIIVTDFHFGTKTLLYSTAEVLTYAVIDEREVLVLWLPAGETGEFAVRGAKSGKQTFVEGSASRTSSNIMFHQDGQSLTVSYSQTSGMMVLDLDDGTQVVLLDRSAAYKFWVPTLSNNPLVLENETGKSDGFCLV